MVGPPSGSALNRPLNPTQHGMQTPPIEDGLLVWSFKLVLDFLTRNHLFSSSLQSKSKDVLMRTPCCTVRYRQGHAGGVRAGPEWELPAGPLGQ